MVREINVYASLQKRHGKTTILNTNGELLLRHLKRHAGDFPFDVVGISIDGATAAVHQAMRGPRASLERTIVAATWASSQPGVRLKVGTVVSAVNLESLPELAVLIRRLRPFVWRLYQYSPWGPQNRGRDRHAVDREQFDTAVQRAVAMVAPIQVASSGVDVTGGCVIVDPGGNILRAEQSGYMVLGNCLRESVAAVWSRLPRPSSVIENKRWLAGI